MNMDKEKWIIFSVIGVGIGLMLFSVYRYYEHQERKEARRLEMEAKKAVATPVVSATNTKTENQPTTRKGLSRLMISDYVNYDITELVPYGMHNQDSLFMAMVRYRKDSRCEDNPIQNSFSQTALGVHFQTNKNYQAAKQCYLLAAKTGNVYATNRLGEMYLLGLGVPKNLDQAKFWLEQSAEKGYYFSEVNLGLMYLDIPLTLKTLDIGSVGGITINKDKVKYMQLGSKANVEQAQYWLSRAKRQNSWEGEILLQRFRLTLNTTPMDTVSKDIEIYSKSDGKTLLLKILATNLPNRYPITSEQQAELKQIMVHAEKLSPPPNHIKSNKLGSHQSTGGNNINNLF